MDFSAALSMMKSGYWVYREGWNGKNMYIYLIKSPSVNGVIFLPFIAMLTAQGALVPWLASQTDILADDWVVKP